MLTSLSPCGVLTQVEAAQSARSPGFASASVTSLLSLRSWHLDDLQCIVEILNNLINKN